MKTIKDIPIKLRDGADVSNGMDVYSVHEKNVSGYRGSSSHYIKSYSGKSRGYIEVEKVISVNQGSGARTFTTRSTKGCETTYSVKNTCLPDTLFGSKEAALKKCREFNLQDCESLKNKIENELTKIQDCKDRIKKYKDTIVKLKK